MTVISTTPSMDCIIPFKLPLISPLTTIISGHNCTHKAAKNDRCTCCSCGRSPDFAWTSAGRETSGLDVPGDAGDVPGGWISLIFSRYDGKVSNVPEILGIVVYSFWWVDYVNLGT